MRSFLLSTALWFFAAAVLGAQTPGMGLGPVPAAIAGTAAEARPNSLKPQGEAPLPVAVDLSEFLPPVQNQGEIGSCAAWSTVYYARTLLEQKERKWGTASEAHRYAPLYTYNQLTLGKNEGTSITDHMALLHDQGIVSFADFPYTDRLDIQPGQDLKVKAGDWKIATYKSIPRKGEEVDLNAIKSFLAKGLPVVGGFSLFEDFPDYTGGVYSTVSGGVIGGHAMAVVGYDDRKQALRLVNSWGPEWGEKGFLWLSYASVRAMTKTDYGFAVMFDITVPVAEPCAPQDLTATQGAAEDSISLSWTKQGTDSSYEVFRADNTTRDWVSRGTLRDNRFTDSGLPPGITYVYSVQTLRDGRSSPRSPVAEGWTQKQASVPGTVQSMDYILYGNGVILVWPPLADTAGYRIFRFDPVSQIFLLLGTSTAGAYKDEAPFETDSKAIYVVQAYNAQGTGTVSDNLEVRQAAAPEKIRTNLKPDIQKGIAQSKPVPRNQQTAFRGTYRRADWFDPRFVDQAFLDFAAQEKAAFAAWKNKDKADFKEFLQNDH